MTAYLTLVTSEFRRHLSGKFSSFLNGAPSNKKGGCMYCRGSKATQVAHKSKTPSLLSITYVQPSIGSSVEEAELTNGFSHAVCSILLWNL